VKKQQVNIPVLITRCAFGDKCSLDHISKSPEQRSLCCETVFHPGNVLYDERVEELANRLNSFRRGADLLVAERFRVQLSVTCF
jgi:hypothetical protein